MKEKNSTVDGKMKGIKKFFHDFKQFISKGNIFDMAVGLIIATAFNTIVSSLVDDILMPLFTWTLGAKSLADLSVVLKWSDNSPSLIWNYGAFLQAILNFLVIAFSLFLMVKFVTNSQKKLKDFNLKLLEQSKKAIKKEEEQVQLLPNTTSVDDMHADIQETVKDENVVENVSDDIVVLAQTLNEKVERQTALLQEICNLLKSEMSNDNTQD